MEDTRVGLKAREKKKKKKRHNKEKIATREEQSCFIDSLPDETLLHCFSFLNEPFSLCTIPLVCKKWRAVGSEPRLWEGVALMLANEKFIDKDIAHLRKKEPEVFKAAVMEIAKINKSFRNYNTCGFVRCEKVPIKPLAPSSKGGGDGVIEFKGDGAVGKTCSLIAWTENKFPTDYVPTVFDNYESVVSISNRQVKISLWDTAGPEGYARIRTLSYPKTDLFVIMFSLVGKTSFANVKDKWIPEVRHHCPEVPVLLAGAKLDLVFQNLKKDSRQYDAPVPYDDAIKMAKKIKAVGFVPFSAITRQNLALVYSGTIDLVVGGSFDRTAKTAEKKKNKKNADKNCCLQ